MPWAAFRVVAAFTLCFVPSLAGTVDARKPITSPKPCVNDGAKPSWKEISTRISANVQKRSRSFFLIGCEMYQSPRSYRFRYFTNGGILIVDSDQDGKVSFPNQKPIPPNDSERFIAALRASWNTGNQGFASRRIGDEFSGIGLAATGSEVATATLITKCHMLTVAHLLIRSPNDTITTKDRVTVGYGAATSSSLFSNVTKASPVAWGRYSYGNWNQDWLVLKLDQCSDGRSARVIPTLAVSALQADRLSIEKVGFSGGLREASSGASIGKACKIAHIDFTGAWIHSCFTEPGDSGGPLIVRQNGEARLVAINSFAGDGLSGAVPVELFTNFLPAR